MSIDLEGDQRRNSVKDRRISLRREHPEFPEDFYHQMTSTGVPQHFGNAFNRPLLQAHALLYPAEAPGLTIWAKEHFLTTLRESETLSQYWKKRTEEHNDKNLPTGGEKLDPDKVINVLVTNQPDPLELEKVSVKLAALGPPADKILGDDEILSLARETVLLVAKATKLLDPVMGKEKSRKILYDNGLAPSPQPTSS